MKHSLGTDVSRDTLEACADPDRETRTFDNTDEGIAELLAWAAECPPSRVVLEASGGYEQRLMDAVTAVGWKVCRVNARRVHHFAKALGENAKTDPIDAAVLQRFGDTFKPAAHVPPAPEQACLLALVKRRVQLVNARTREINQGHTAPEAVQSSHQRMRKALDQEIKKIEAKIVACIDQTTALKTRTELLASTPGVGRVSAATLCGTLPELGHYTRGAISALVGIAPMADDSGKHHGQRHIGGGRSLPRTALYHVTLSAIRCNPRIKALYARLKARGKPSKVAMIACMRHLLCAFNAMLRDGKSWAENPAIP